MALEPGTRLGPYEIVALLGAGGMGEVYRARDTRLGREVAVKVLPPSFAQNAEALVRFEREARAVAALSHPNILALHDFGTNDGTTFAVTELLDGETLRQRLAGGPLSPRKASEYGAQIMNGLAAAHDRGIVHRDLKPENLFITRDGRVKILDFGLARSAPAPGGSGMSTLPTVEQQTEPGTILGTAGYMSPEQVRGAPVDHRTDIFSFGAVLYEMLTGQKAFWGGTAVESMNLILNGEPPEISDTGNSAPADLERIVRHCLEKSPGERFQSAHDVAFALQSLSGISGTAGPRAGSWSGRTPRRRLAEAAGILAVVASLAFLAGRLLRGPDSHLGNIHAHRLTFRRGFVPSARFAPDGETIVYTAAWDGRPLAIFAMRLDSLGEHPAGASNAKVLSVSRRGELAFLWNVQIREEGDIGTLAREPLSGGAPRLLLEDVISADWAPNAEELAVVRETSTGRRIEYPIGHVLLESTGIDHLRISPAGDLVAFVDGSGSEKGFTIGVVDPKGKTRVLTRGWFGLRIAWSPDGREVVFSGYREANDRVIAAVDLSGRERVLLPAAGLLVHDVFRDGRLLAQRVNSRTGILLLGSGGDEHDLSWMDTSWVFDISRDGHSIVFVDGSTGSDLSVYLRPTDGSPAIRLGSGENPSLSPDGKWVSALRRGAKTEIALLPTGAGAPRTLAIENLLNAQFLADGRILLLREAGRGPPTLAVTTVDGSRPRTVDLRAVAFEYSLVPSRDARQIAYARAGGQVHTLPIDGGEDHLVPGKGLARGESILQWSEDEAALFVLRQDGIVQRISRIDIVSGERTLWREVRPSDPTGVVEISNLLMTPDGKSIVYSCKRSESAGLFIIDGLLSGRSGSRP